MQLFPILRTREENEAVFSQPDLLENLQHSVKYYERIGYHPPWLMYYAQVKDEVVATGGFKGAPRQGKVEIAYLTFDKFRHQGFGTMLCGKLVELSRTSDPTVVVTARTLPQKNYSTRILEKNRFRMIGPVQDEEDGEVWEWQFVTD